MRIALIVVGKERKEWKSRFQPMKMRPLQTNVFVVMVVDL